MFGFFSVTSVAFVMQACYGTPPDMGLKILFQGKVVDKNTQLPLKRIKVLTEFGSYDYSNDEGYVRIFIPETEVLDSVRIVCEDIDYMDNGSYARLDTLIPYMVLDDCVLPMRYVE
jgi:hypothetical protein